MSSVNVVHAQSELVTKNEVELFSVPGTQVSIESCQNTVYYPISSIMSGETSIEWFINNLSDQYIDLSSMHFQITAQIVRSDGSEPVTRDGDDVTEDVVYPVNGAGAALFKYVNLYANQRLVSSNCLNSYRSIVDTIIHTNPHIQRTVDECGMYYYDGGDFAVNNLQSRSAKSRYARVKGGKVFELLMHVNTDIANQSRLLLPGVSLRIVATHNPDSFRLISGADEEHTHQLKILTAALNVRKVKVSHSTFLSHQRELCNRPACYVMRGLQTKVRSVGAGSLDAIVDNLYSDRIPDRLTMVMVRTDAFQGDFSLSPFTFEHFNLTNVTLTVDSFRRELVYDFDNDIGRGSYFSFLSELGEKHCELTYEKYKTNSFIIHWNLSADQTMGPYFNPFQKGNVRLELKFGEPLTHAISLILISESPKVMTIDGDLIVRVD